MYSCSVQQPLVILHLSSLNKHLAATAGIWGGKGQGKTFQCTLAYKKLDIAPIVMSAGELESGNAGEPAKLIRQRYREVRLPQGPSHHCPLCLHAAGSLGSTDWPTSLI